MSKNKIIAIHVQGVSNSDTQTDAENLQYNLLGRGFKWSTGQDSYLDLSDIMNFVLYVDVKNKTLDWNKFRSDDACTSVASTLIRLWNVQLSGAIQAILALEKSSDYVEIEGVEFYNQRVRVYDDKDTVEFYEAGDHMLTTDKATINGVAAILGVKEEVVAKPNIVVQFDYAANKWDSVTRRVQLLSLDSDYLTGIELSRGADATGTFKKYRVDKIDGAIKLYSFETK